MRKNSTVSSSYVRDLVRKEWRFFQWFFYKYNTSTKDKTCLSNFTCGIFNETCSTEIKIDFIQHHPLLSYCYVTANVSQWLNAQIEFFVWLLWHGKSFKTLYITMIYITIGRAFTHTHTRSIVVCTRAPIYIVENYMYVSGLYTYIYVRMNA